jgi:hypothetical protein
MLQRYTEYFVWFIAYYMFLMLGKIVVYMLTIPLNCYGFILVMVLKRKKKVTLPRNVRSSFTVHK